MEQNRQSPGQQGWQQPRNQFGQSRSPDPRRPPDQNSQHGGEMPSQPGQCGQGGQRSNTDMERGGGDQQRRERGADVVGNKP